MVEVNPREIALVIALRQNDPGVTFKPRVLYAFAMSSLRMFRFQKTGKAANGSSSSKADGGENGAHATGGGEAENGSSSSKAASTSHDPAGEDTQSMDFLEKPVSG